MRTLGVRPIRRIEELEQLAPAWEPLAQGVPFREPTWLLTWWRHYSRRRPPRVGSYTMFALAVEEDGRLIGLAPWFTEQMAWTGRVLQSFGSGTVCSDYLTLPAEPGREAEVAQAVARFLCDDARGEWDRLNFDAAVQLDPVLTALFDELARRGLVVDRRAGPHCWRIALPDSWDTYLSMLSKSHRKQLRRLTNRVLDTRRAVWHTTRDEDDFARDWALFVELHQRRRRSLGESGRFADERFSSFHEDVARRMLRRGQLRLHRLELDGRPVAAEYHLAGRSAIYAYQSGIEPDALDSEPGRLAAIDVIRQALLDGFTSYDLLRGDEAYKAHWRAQALATEQVSVIGPRLTSRLRHAAIKNGRRLRNAWTESGLVRRPMTSGALPIVVEQHDDVPEMHDEPIDMKDKEPVAAAVVPLETTRV
jgi:CelD/BcsL family acetyltransferase involved in cellulose biosynthesis